MEGRPTGERCRVYGGHYRGWFVVVVRGVVVGTGTSERKAIGRAVVSDVADYSDLWDLEELRRRFILKGPMEGGELSVQSGDVVIYQEIGQPPQEGEQACRAL